MIRLLWFFSVHLIMVNWPLVHFQARLHAATEPGFLAIRHLEVVALNGGHLGYCLNLGINLNTPEGQEAANFQAALIMFCWELCSQGVGHVPYQPVPLNLGPLGPIVAGAPGVPPANHPPAPPEDNDFVEIIGGVHPVHGPWVVDHDFVEVLGGVHPVHGPWVEGAPPVDNLEQQPNQGDGGGLPIIDFDFDLDLL
jgi:hypothetical protein